MDELLAGLKAIAEATRVRILFILAHGELNVSELTYILGQSQPRVSRHLKLMTEAGLVSRQKEGNWVLFRLRDEGLSGALSKSVFDMLSPRDATLSGDLSRLEEVRRQRAEAAAAYFAANAANWAKLRSYHLQEEDVEAAILDLAREFRPKNLVDLGTGTGRMLELFAGHATTLTGLDLSREMLTFARSALENKAIKNAKVRQADLYALPLADKSADFIVIHQVLHFLDEPQKALLEARRIMTSDGHALIVDFAPHDLEELRTEHAHRRLGLSSEQMQTWLTRAGFETEKHLVLPPPWLKSGKGLTVSLWLVRPTIDTHFNPSLTKTTATP